MLSCLARYGLWGSSARWFISWFQCCINQLFVFLLTFPYFLPSLYFLHYLFTSLFIHTPDLSTPPRKDPSVSRPEVEETTKPGFSFLCYFYVVVYFVMDACLLLLCFFTFLSTKPKDWLGRLSLKWPVLCRVGCKSLTQSTKLFHSEKGDSYSWIENSFCRHQSHIRAFVMFRMLLI